MNRYEFETKVARYHELVMSHDAATPKCLRERDALVRDISMAPFEFEEGKLRGKTMTFSDDSVSLLDVRTVGDLMAELSRLPPTLDIVSIEADGDYRNGVTLHIIKDPDTLSLRIGDL